ncbi:MAG TPA: hypothetical protein PKV10_01870 [Thermoanaerobaculia bacterium]|nr:hypothetical protein [Thermoanaerobaculia bacterium]
MSGPSTGILRGTILPASWLVVLMTFSCASITYVSVPPPKIKVEKTHPCAEGKDWVPGAWAWKNGQYVWLPGHCKKRPRAGTRWIPGKWEKCDSGWYWIPGRWSR